MDDILNSWARLDCGRGREEVRGPHAERQRQGWEGKGRARKEGREAVGEGGKGHDQAGGAVERRIRRWSRARGEIGDAKSEITALRRRERRGEEWRGEERDRDASRYSRRCHSAPSPWTSRLLLCDGGAAGWLTRLLAAN